MVTYSILAWRSPLDRGAWRAALHGITKSWIQFSNQHAHTCVSICLYICIYRYNPYKHAKGELPVKCVLKSYIQ